MKAKNLRILATALVSIATTANAQSYRIIDLGTLGGPSSSGAGINNLGQVTGSSVNASGATHAFVTNSSGQMIDLGTLGGSVSFGAGINDLGRVTGGSSIASGDNHTFVTNSNQQMVDFGTSFSGGVGINATGQVAGTFWTGSAFQAFRTDSSGNVTDLGAFTAGGLSYGYGINAAGQVTGMSFVTDSNVHAFRTDSSGQMADLGSLATGWDSWGYGINASGQVTGASAPPQSCCPAHAFVTITSGQMIDLGILSGNGSTAGLGINDSGQVVGVTGGGPFVTINGVMTRLSSLLDSSGSGWTLQSATAINNVGQIAGTGINPAGQTHAFLLTSVDSVIVPFLTLPIDPTFEGNKPCTGGTCTIHSVAIAAIVDHSLNGNQYNCSQKGPPLGSWGCDDTVLAFDGHDGLSSTGVVCSPGIAAGYQNARGTIFKLTGINYIGGGCVQWGNNKTFLNYDGHSGTDFPYVKNTPILAAGDGILAIPATDPINSWNQKTTKKTPHQQYNSIMITHSNGLQTWYLHALAGSECIAFSTTNTPCAPSDSKGRNANLGKSVHVNKGDTIGWIGAVGATSDTGTSNFHLHFELRRSADPTVDPYTHPLKPLSDIVDPFGCVSTVQAQDPQACLGYLWSE